MIMNSNYVKKHWRCFNYAGSSSNNNNSDAAVTKEMKIIKIFRTRSFSNVAFNFS